MAGRKTRAHPWRLSDEQRWEVERRIGAGETQEDVAVAVGCDVRTVIRWVMRTGGLRSYERRRSPLRLSLAEREEIALGLARGESATVIAGRSGRAVSTITREIAANGGRGGYVACRADARALELARRPKPAKLPACARLRANVEAGLMVRWSPQQIAARLIVDYPDDAEMRVSHETIYQSLFVQSRGALRRELTKCLRTKRVHRRPGGVSIAGGLRDMVPISQRPAEATDRAVPGHWEGDLLIGKAGRSAIATLVERTTRYTMLVRVDDRTTIAVCTALATSIQRLPETLRRSLTWDQGKEMANHATFSVASGVKVYFCDPSSPWQRGTNENTNGLLRQYFPKGTDLTQYHQHDLDAVADELNGRPRQTLSWMKPSEAFEQLVALTA
jgi:transposase, IS30 family